MTCKNCGSNGNHAAGCKRRKSKSGPKPYIGNPEPVQESPPEPRRPRAYVHVTETRGGDYVVRTVKGLKLSHGPTEAVAMDRAREHPAIVEGRIEIVVREAVR